MFQPKGQILIEGKDVTEERMMEAAIEAGATDVQPPEDEDEPTWTVMTETSEFSRIKSSLEQAGFTISDAGLVMIPDNFSAISGAHASSFLELVDALEDLEDVQKVWSNAKIEDAAAG
jgi:transcriptional/translational regulatory protein YebC/TACO1